MPLPMPLPESLFLAEQRTATGTSRRSSETLLHQPLAVAPTKNAVVGPERARAGARAWARSKQQKPRSEGASVGEAAFGSAPAIADVRWDVRARAALLRP